MYTLYLQKLRVAKVILYDNDHIIIVTGNINFLYLICSSLHKSHFERQSLIVYLLIYFIFLFRTHKHLQTYVTNIYMQHTEKKKLNEYNYFSSDLVYNCITIYLIFYLDMFICIVL